MWKHGIGVALNWVGMFAYVTANLFGAGVMYSTGVLGRVVRDHPSFAYPGIALLFLFGVITWTLFRFLHAVYGILALIAWLAGITPKGHQQTPERLRRIAERASENL